MLEPGEIVYGFVKDIHPPKNKYIITIYRDDELRIVTCFTTTKNRVGVPLETLTHGYVKNGDDIVGYFFDKSIVIGHNPGTNSEYHFPRNCVIPFGYGIREGSKENILAELDHPEVVCTLSKKEYRDIVYAMYRSRQTNPKYKPYLEKILQELCEE